MDGKVILGIDPGTNRTGYGIVRSEGNALHLVVLGDIDLHRIGDPYRKLQHIFERVCQLIDTYRRSNRPFSARTCRACSNSDGRRESLWPPR